MTEVADGEAARPVEAALMDLVADVRGLPPLPEGIDRSDCLPPDLDYCLDAEQEIGGISHDERSYVSIFDEDTFGWFLPLTRGNAADFPRIVKARYARWRETAPLDRRMALTWGGLEALKWLFESAERDFALQIVQRHAVSDLPDGAETAMVEAADVANDPVMEMFASCARPVVARAVRDIEEAGVEAFVAARGTLDRLYDEAMPRIRERNRRVNEMLRRYADDTVRRSLPTFEGASRIRTRAHKRREKGLRKAMARSFALLGSVAGGETARACLDGEQIVVEGRKFDFRLRVANLRSTAHGAVEVFVLDKSAVELAALCIYIDQTPALDQMAALILDVTAGNEDEIVRRANVIRSTEAAASNAAFRELRRKVDAVVPPIPLPGAFGLPQPAVRPSAEFLPAVRRRLAAAADEIAWRPLIAILGPEFAFERFVAVDRDGMAADLTGPWRRNRLAVPDVAG